MGKVYVGINLEFVRHADKPFEWAVEKAAELGYTYLEPWVHWGRELMSEAGYYMTVSMLDDPYRIKRACDKAGIKLSGLSSHTATAARWRPSCRAGRGSTSPRRQSRRWSRRFGSFRA